MTRTINIRIEEHLYEALREQAESDGRSLNNLIARLLAESQRAAEGHSTLGRSPRRDARPAAGGMKSLTRKRPEKGVKPPLQAPAGYDASHGHDPAADLQALAKINAKVQDARAAKQPAEGVGPEEWPDFR